MLREAGASGLLLLVVFGLLWTPMAAVAVPEEANDTDVLGLVGDPDRQEPAADLGEGLTWFAPEQVRVGHPVHAAVAVLTGDGLATSMHQDLSIWVTLDDEVLLHTPSVHEHQGLHLVTVTPQEPGTLKFWADDGSGGHDDHLLASAAAPEASLPEPKGMATEVEVVGEPLEGAALVRPEVDFEVGFNWALVVENESIPYSSQLTASDGQGRLLMSGWPLTRFDSSFWMTVQGKQLYGHGIFTPHPGAEVTPFTQTAERVDPPLLQGPLPQVIQALVPPMGVLEGPSCQEAPGRLVIDPNSALINEDIRGFQEWSDIRVHYLDPDRLEDPQPSAIRYSLVEWPAVTEDEFPLRLGMTTDHPLAYFAMRPLNPGNYVLGVGQQETDGSTSWICSEQFRLLPEPAALEGAGELAVDLEADGDLLVATLRSVRDGEALPHYEFDVQVVRLEDDHPAALAWRGKLHGHAGEVSFLMSSLAPGEYEMRVQPSPQDPGIAPVAAGPDGFVFPFTVEGARLVEFEEVGQDIEALPSPVGLVFLGIAGLVSFVALRRRV